MGCFWSSCCAIRLQSEPTSEKNKELREAYVPTMYLEPFTENKEINVSKNYSKAGNEKLEFTIRESLWQEDKETLMEKLLVTKKILVNDIKADGFCSCESLNISDFDNTVALDSKTNEMVPQNILRDEGKEEDLTFNPVASRGVASIRLDNIMEMSSGGNTDERDETLGGMRQYVQTPSLGDNGLYVHTPTLCDHYHSQSDITTVDEETASGRCQDEFMNFSPLRYVSIGNKGLSIGGFGCVLTLGSDVTLSVLGKDLITTKESSEANSFGFFQK